MVVIDTPPLVAVTDAAVVSTVADAVLLVVRAKRTKRQELRNGALRPAGRRRQHRRDRINQVGLDELVELLRVRLRPDAGSSRQPVRWR